MDLIYSNVTHDKTYLRYDASLDRLYMKGIKCPYCKTKIPKLTTTCSKCGLHKIQIAYASNQRAKEIIKNKTGEKIVMIRRRPDDLRMGSLAWRMLLGGIFGAHCFYVGRRTRGWIIFALMAAFVISTLAFPIGDPRNDFASMNIWREAMMGWGMPFVTDFLGFGALWMWVKDCFAIVFGFFKYPVRLSERNGTFIKTPSVQNSSDIMPSSSTQIQSVSSGD